MAPLWDQERARVIREFRERMRGFLQRWLDARDFLDRNDITGEAAAYYNGFFPIADPELGRTLSHYRRQDYTLVTERVLDAVEQLRNLALLFRKRRRDYELEMGARIEALRVIHDVAQGNRAVEEALIRIWTDAYNQSLRGANTLPMTRN